MKNKIFLVLIITVSFILYSCSEDKLDFNPTNRYTEEIFWLNEIQAEAGLAACYNPLRNAGAYGSATPLWQEVFTPNATAYQSPMLQIGQSLHDAGSGGIISSRWSTSWQGIGRCNTLIERIVDVPMSESKRNGMIAQAKFLRALYYSKLINHYGDVPLILESPRLEHVELPRTPKSEVLTQIIKDLDEAAAILPVNAAPGMPTKGACYALKARQYIYNSMFAEAAASAKQVMDMDKYKLFPNYRDLFMPEYQSNDEVIFEVVFHAPLYGHSYDLINRQYNSNAPIRDLIDAYLMADGSTIDESPDYDPDAYWENRDPRFKMNIVYPGSMYMGQIVTDSRFALTGYSIKKYSIYDDDNQYNNVFLHGGQSDINYMVLRYADILLIYAEAKTELNQIDQSVYDAINMVRSRAGMVEVQHSNPELPTYVAMGDQAKMRETIRLERRIEFAGEGYYLMDIWRWRIAHEVMRGPVYNFNYDYMWDRYFDESRNYLWPIPQSEMDNSPNFVQNPGF